MLQEHKSLSGRSVVSQMLWFLRFRREKDSWDGIIVSNFMNRTFFRLEVLSDSLSSPVLIFLEDFRRSNRRLLFMPTRLRKLPMNEPQFKLPQSSPLDSEGNSSSWSLLPIFSPPMSFRLPDSSSSSMSSARLALWLLALLSHRVLRLSSRSSSISCRRS